MIHTIIYCTGAGRGARLLLREDGAARQTSVALSVCHNPTVKALFQERRFVVECDMIGTPARLLKELASWLNIECSEDDHHFFVLTVIKRISRNLPLLLILKNAESFISSSDTTHAKQIDTILSSLAALPNVTLIITQRDSGRLALTLEWDIMGEFNVMSPEVTRDRFMSATGFPPEERVNPRPDALLEALDCVPLAVALLAQTSHTGSGNLELLRKRWYERNTDFLRHHGRVNFQERVGTSIEDSLQSRIMVDNPHAERLLGILSLFPDGISMANVKELSTEWEVHTYCAAQALKQLSLAHESPSGSGFLTTPSQIRYYIARHYPISNKDLELVRRWLAGKVAASIPVLQDMHQLLVKR
jgi:hypothetical protein